VIPLSTEEIQRLRKLAEDYVGLQQLVDAGKPRLKEALDKAHTEYLLATAPATILSLIAELEKAHV
jgi:hypothetical protein